ncbi:MAG: hypothetical protein WA949_10530 [Phormidesmis sp.]
MSDSLSQDERYRFLLSARLSARCRVFSSSYESQLRLRSSPSDLPGDFPDVEAPCFSYGDRLRWKTNDATTDWGIVIGRFYSFAPHRRCWRWCYLIWLSPDSPSISWVRADTAWEDDLEFFKTESQL